MKRQRVNIHISINEEDVNEHFVRNVKTCFQIMFLCFLEFLIIFYGFIFHLLVILCFHIFNAFHNFRCFRVCFRFVCMDSHYFALQTFSWISWGSTGLIQMILAKWSQPNEPSRGTSAHYAFSELTGSQEHRHSTRSAGIE